MRLAAIEPTSRHRERVSRLGEIVVEASVLARHAEGADVDRLVLRRTLRKLAMFSDGELRCVARLACLSREELAELLDSVAAPPRALGNEDEEHDG